MTISTVYDPLTQIEVAVPTTAAYSTSTSGAYTAIISQGPSNYVIGQGATSSTGILTQQVATSNPDLPTLKQATGMLSADKSTSERLQANFDPTLYDLSDSSHLSRFLRVLMGDSGAGQLRKRYTVTRLTSILDSTHFYDLDGFYGSLLSVPRRSDERLSIDPMDPDSGLASEDDWDALMAADARYRERIINLARSLLMAGTPEGIKAVAEVLTDAHCEVTETWKLIEDDFGSKTANLWDEVSGTYPNWNAMKAYTWEEVSGVVHLGWEGIDTPDEAYVSTYKTYDGTPEEQAAAQAWDEAELLRVLDIIKPAGVLLTVNSTGVITTVSTPISAVAADSEYWSITKTIYPSTTNSTTSIPATYQAATVDGAQGLSVPLPPFAGSQQFEWFANSSITQVIGRSLSGSFDMATAEHTDQGNTKGNGGWSQNYESIMFPDVNQSFTFYPGYAVLSPRVLLGGQAVNDSVMQAHPYAASRAAGKVVTGV